MSQLLLTLGARAGTRQGPGLPQGLPQGLPGGLTDVLDRLRPGAGPIRGPAGPAGQILVHHVPTPSRLPNSLGDHYLLDFSPESVRNP